MPKLGKRPDKRRETFRSSANDEAYLDTVRMINAFALVGTTKDLTKLISFLNAGIKRYKEQVMTRAKKKDDDKTPTATGCPQAFISSADGR